MDEEGMQDTDNQLIHIGKPIEMDEQKFMQQLAKLKEAANEDSHGLWFGNLFRKIELFLYNDYLYLCKKFKGEKLCN